MYGMPGAGGRRCNKSVVRHVLVYEKLGGPIRFTPGLPGLQFSGLPKLPGLQFPGLPGLQFPGLQDY